MKKPAIQRHLYLVEYNGFIFVTARASNHCNMHLKLQSLY